MESEKIICPLVDEQIEDYECIEVSDCANEIMKEEVIHSRFRTKKDWRKTCNECKNNRE